MTDRAGVPVHADGIEIMTFGPVRITELDAGFAGMEAKTQEEYKRHHPSDTRSLEDRIDDARQADLNGELALEMAVCPYCGTVPALSIHGYCCKLGGVK
jgi:hypothetical protein